MNVPPRTATDLDSDDTELDERSLLEMLITRVYRNRIALLSSFGADAAVLLHMVARIDGATPVLFIDTGKLFPETLDYARRLTSHLGLTDVRVVRPDATSIAKSDAEGDLWRHAPDACCVLRKVVPLGPAISGFSALITGRKRQHGGMRSTLAKVEDDGERVRINPLAAWTSDDIRADMRANDLPEHPLAARGFASIGCVPCTTPVRSGESPRAGRWRGRGKTECGIHFQRRPPDERHRPALRLRLKIAAS